MERIGKVSYRLALPDGARIHDVLHVGALKAFHGIAPAAAPTLLPMEHDKLHPTPERVLRAIVCHGIWHVLVQRGRTEADDATWQPVQQSVTSTLPVNSRTSCS